MVTKHKIILKIEIDTGEYQDDQDLANMFNTMVAYIDNGVWIKTKEIEK